MKSEKKVAVVIGATGNLGSAICKALGEEGYYLDPVWLKNNHPDATLAKSYLNLPPKIHLAVYLAGINIIEKTEKLTEDQWNQVINVNLKGAFLLAKAAFPAMKAVRGATFITISSIMTTHPYPFRMAYAASKAGLEGLTRALAVEWGKYEISTHCIRLGHLAGLMKTTPPNPLLLKTVKEKTPSGQLIQPGDVAQYIVWLAKGGAKSVAGSIIDFDPAYTINRWPL